MKKWKKVLDVMLLLAAMLAFYVYKEGLEKGIDKFVDLLIFFAVATPVIWVFFRIMTGSWDIEKWGKGGPKPGDAEYLKRHKNLFLFAGKKLLKAAVIVVAITWLIIGFVKLYIYYKTGGWYIR